MGRNFHRKCVVTLSGSRSRTITGGGETDLRIVFKVEASTLQRPGAGQIRIYNPSQSTIAQFKNKEFISVSLDAGYEDNCGRIYSGTIVQSFVKREDAATSYLALFCQDGDTAYNQGRVSTTLSAGHTPQDRVNSAVQAMAPFGVSLGIVNVDLSRPQFPRGIPLVGMARDVLRSVALSAGAQWSLQQGKLHIVDIRKPVPGSTLVMNSQTGMIGWPEQTEDGIIVRSLINPILKIHSKVKIDEKSIQQADPDYGSITSSISERSINLANTGTIAADGIYNVYFIEREGDTRGGPWYDTSTVLATAAQLNPGQIQSSPVPTLGQS